MTVQALASARAKVFETSVGSGGDATNIIYFREAEHIQDVGTISPQEGFAKYAPFRRHYAGLQRGGLRFAGDWTYQQALFWLSLSEKGLSSASSGPTDSAYTWTYLPTEPSDDHKSAKFEFSYGDFIATWGASLPGCKVEELTVNWTKAVGDDETGISYEAIVMSAYGTTQLTAFTGSLSDVAQISALGTTTTIYIDTTTIGTTADGRIPSCSYHLTNGNVYRDALDNTGLAAEIVRAKKRMWEFTFQRYFNSKTERDAFIAKTTRKIRVKTTGALIGVSSVYTSQLDLYGVLSSLSSSESDGLIYENFTLRPVYDTSVLSDHQWSIINANATTATV